MKRAKSLSCMIVLGLLAAATHGQILKISGPLHLALKAWVQQGETVQTTPGGGYSYLLSATTSNLTITTKSLLKMIAADQGFTLPPRAKLWLDDDTFYILRQDNTIFTNIDYEILSIAYANNVLAYKTIQKGGHYQSTVAGTLIATIYYNSSSLSFALDCYGKNTFYTAADGTNAVAVNSFTGQAFGCGSTDGHDMVLKGTLGGRQTQGYKVADGGILPPFLGNPTGSFPGLDGQRIEASGGQER
ncbi:MAG TPA: hypothetical protein VMB80_14615 [Candidatus Acidoferrum sp.]|nr:hypothetical protein [Candidatus Acidoferrum sp.]